MSDKSRFGRASTVNDEGHLKLTEESRLRDTRGRGASVPKLLVRGYGS